MNHQIRLISTFTQGTAFATSPESGLLLLRRWLVLVAVGLFPVVMGTVKSGAGALFYLLFLVGVATVGSGWRRLENWERHLLFGFVLVAGYGLLSISWASDTAYAWRRFEKFSLFVLAIPVYMLVRRYSDQAYKALLCGLIVAGPVMAWVGLETLRYGRAQGAYNHILYGDFTLLVALSALSGALLARRGLLISILLILSAGFALYGSFLTQTRGPWLVLPIALLLFLWICAQRFSGRAKWLVLFGVVLAACVSAGVASSTDIFQQRAALAVSSFEDYRNGSLTGSVGTRFAMWEAAVEHWKVSPVFGSGLGDYGYDMRQLADKNPYYVPVAQYSEGHSLYFEHLATLGVVGLGLLVGGLFLYPLRIFWRHIRSSDPVIQYLAFDGVLVVISVMNDGITQNWLSRSSITVAYIMLLVVLLTGIAGRTQQLHTEPLQT